MIKIDPEVRELVRRKIETFNREEILDAVRISESFPPPGLEAADEVAQLIHDIAQHAESLGEWQLCASLYWRALHYKTANPGIPAGTWYRYGLCQERIGQFREAISAFRNVVPFGITWPHVRALAQRRLADLLIAAEEYEAARQTLTELAQTLPQPEIRAEEVELDLAKCLLHLGRWKEARRRIENCPGLLVAPETGVEALKTLAQICELEGDAEAAERCYNQILGSGLADTNLKLAAAHRLAALKKR